MTFIASRILRSAMVAGLALSPVAAHAQAAEGAEASQEDMMSFSDAQLESFADATLKLQEVRSTYVPQLQNASDDAERQEIAQEANTAMVAAVRAADGITVETYNAISRLAQTDEELNQRLVSMVQQRMQTEPGADEMESNEG
ncbi:hypothetical protein OB2597_14891 [Pseudooceanicola batsensis HTCC2597]|uniref:DUF4168 domain-containing protein n=1 Tax=Pseudooceanicola batsensis (strain ATCC BAA-863 / DSM 15984 / KCTC 12145 / HTCC2597) TaxID=252305 RepID=A3U2E0_PSEBH|nr:DUF4168 domain-containing protein [Pseudooceanicola batsensis]EAQ01740.1 hypothetical protein OB2597_14891 [Pseudooceanicola batsensis HTCC2597]